MGELFSSCNPVKVYRVQSIGGKNAVMQLIKKVTEIAQLKNTRKLRLGFEIFGGLERSFWSTNLPLINESANLF